MNPYGYPGAYPPPGGYYGGVPGAYPAPGVYPTPGYGAAPGVYYGRKFKKGYGYGGGYAAPMYGGGYGGYGGYGGRKFKKWKW